MVGNNNTKYGSYLKEKFSANKAIRFIGAEFNINKLNNLRYFSNFYFHGHSVGGTNPSLLEAMASKAFIIAHNNHFNKAILKENGYYFSNPIEVKNILSRVKKSDNLPFIQNNFEAIENEFNWDKINGAYLQLFEKSLSGNQILNEAKPHFCGTDFCFNFYSSWLRNQRNCSGPFCFNNSGHVKKIKYKNR